MIERTNVHGFSVRVLADSMAFGTRITTMELVYPRFIHAEFMTHRMFSRNASSSRAIPVERMLEGCTAMPIHWGANIPGMQANEELTNWDHHKELLEEFANETEGFFTGPNADMKVQLWESPGTSPKDVGVLWWEDARREACNSASDLAFAGFHKQVVNRLTEPFQFIKVVVTATEWENFFHLRDHDAAQPEIHELARLMKEAMTESEAKEFDEGDWHVPYYHEGFWQDTGDGTDLLGNSAEQARRASAAGCARVSYNNHDGSDPDPEKDAKLYAMLKDMEHMSPFEHQATPMGLRAVNVTTEFDFIFEEGVTHFDRKGKAWSGNFCNWVQLRQMGSFNEAD